MSNNIELASKLLAEMKPAAVIKAVRAKDVRVIHALVKDGVKNRKIWTAEEVSELTDTPIRTVYNWLEE